jgi:hypothetical protein
MAGILGSLSGLHGDLEKVSGLSGPSGLSREWPESLAVLVGSTGTSRKLVGLVGLVGSLVSEPLCLAAHILLHLVSCTHVSGSLVRLKTKTPRCTE